MVAIVVLHVSANGVNRLPFASDDWWLAESINALCRAGVPLFLMLTGALLVRRPRSDLAAFYARRFHRLAPALIGWSVFYLLWSALKAQVKHTPYSFSDAALSLLQGTPYFHLWFVFMLLGVYAAIPLLQTSWHRFSTQGRTVVLAASLLCQQLGLLLYFQLQGPALPWPLWFIAYLPYVWLGAYLAEYLPKVPPTVRRFMPWAGFSTWLLCSAVIAGLRYWQQANYGPEPFYYSHHRLSLPILFSAVGLWVYLSNGPIIVADRLLPLSLTLYCVHPLWLDLTTMLLAPWPISYWLVLPLQSLLVFAGSLLIAMLFTRLPRQHRQPNTAAH